LGSGSHPDFVRIYPGQRVDPDDKGEAIQIKAVRRLVLPRVTVGPAIGDLVAVLIQQAERMTWGAANALLKTLEEPPEWMRLVLTASASDAVPPTILSRCTLVAFGQVSHQELQEGLARLFGATEEVAKDVAFLAAGSPGRAIALLEDPDARDRARRMAEFVGDLAKATRAEALSIAERLQEAASSQGSGEELSARAALAESLAHLAQCFRDAAALRLRADPLSLAVPMAQDALRRLSERAPAGHWCACAEQALEARNRVLGNASARYQLDALLTSVVAGLGD
jgi:DNA polymerase III gamma/tau subunit